MDFISIDFETANDNYNSACALGLVMVKDNKIISSEYYLIQPPTLEFNQKNIDIHGITPEDVSDKPKFPEIWEGISKYFNGSTYIIAHNATFDMSVLKVCLEDYELDIPNFNYICSMTISSRATKKLNRPAKDYRTLDKLCELLNINLEHHNALSDANACAGIVLKTLELTKRKNINTFISTYNSIKVRSFETLEVKNREFSKGKKFKRIRVSEITANNNQFDTKHPFYNKNIVFTGDLMDIDRRSAMQNVVDLGGINKSGVTSKTNYLVVGKQDLKVVGDDGLSTKERKALKLIEDGIDIKIINENEFLKILR